MRRFILVLAVSALMAAMLVVTAVPAFATVHQLADMERANDNASPVVDFQDPPGVSDGGNPALVLQPEHPNLSDNSDTLNEECGDPTRPSSCPGNFAQPIIKADDQAFQCRPAQDPATCNPGEK